MSTHHASGTSPTNPTRSLPTDDASAAHGTRPTTGVGRLKKRLVFAGMAALDRALPLLTPRASTHKVLLAPGFESLRWTLGRWRAWRTFELAGRRVPGYRAFLDAHGAPHTLDIAPSRIREAWATLPEMDKDSYVRRYSIAERTFGGKLPRRGVVVDESSGSSGTPTSWVRGPSERHATRNLLQLGYAQTAKDLSKQPFVLNAFSLGAWATGMNVTASLTEVTMMKSIGPDPDKIVNTMREFGPGFTYVIMSYPPFLKSLFEDERLDWSQYDIVAAFGGEGISESMRTQILKTAHKVYGCYGASDLEINLGLETDYTVALRRAIAEDPELAAALTKQGEYGVLPMIFQFNPFNYLVETNEGGELVVTITRRHNISPRLRYNIHDRGHVTRLRDVNKVLRERGHGDVIAEQLLDLPLLFHYGRSDLSVDYNGAVVAPDSLRDVVFADAELGSIVENHRLISLEDARGDRQLHLALQLIPDAAPLDADAANAAAVRIGAALRRLNGDLDHAILTAPEATLPSLEFYAYRTGPFAGDGAKLKNEYVWQLNAHDAAGHGLRLGRLLRP